jgi:hypothetical protein
VQIELTPEPTPEEREALLRALGSAEAPADAGSAAWWEAGVREAIEADPESVAVD